MECLVWSVALYGAETWTLTRTDQTDLDLDLVPPVLDKTFGRRDFSTSVDRWQLSLHHAKLGSFGVGLS